MIGPVVFVAIPKAFEKDTDRIQCNAIRSWQQLDIDKRIILMGEPSAAAIAAEVGAKLLPDLPVDEFGTPLFGPAIERASAMGGELICYINADIIVLPELTDAIRRCRAASDRFLMVAKRWNYDCGDTLAFERGWAEALRADVLACGKLFAPQAIDIFCFTPSTYRSIPPFAVGRSYWDNWMIDAARKRNADVIDVTARAMLVHQNHPYAGFANLREIRDSIQGRRNFFLAGDSHMGMATVDDATHAMDAEGRITRCRTANVTVVIPFASGPRQLRRLLNALVHQDYPRTYIETVVVVNNQDLDLGSIRADFPWVRFTSELTRSAAAARNKGLAVGRGDVIAFIDCDCVPDKDWIAEGVAALFTERSPAFVGGAIEQVAGGGRPRSAAGALAATMFLQQRSYVENHGTCVTANMFVERRTIDLVGWFDEEFVGAGGEDWEWCRRAGALGVLAVYAERARVRHPMLRNRQELARKLTRVVTGNARLRRGQAAKQGGNASVRSEHKEPGLGWLIKRSRSALADDRLTIREKALAVPILVSLLPQLRRIWRTALAEGEHS